MFNGIIYNVGKVIRIDKRSKGINLFLKSNLKLYKKKTIGMSISCDGVCLTLISKKKNILEFFLSNETLIRSKFNNIKIGQILIDEPYPFGLIKIIDPDFTEYKDKDLLINDSKSKIIQ